MESNNEAFIIILGTPFEPLDRDILEFLMKNVKILSLKLAIFSLFYKRWKVIK